MPSADHLLGAVGRILRPLVRLLIRNGVPSDAMTELVRKIYVDVAEHDFPLEGKRQTVSRISVITGLNRKEVSRLRSTDTFDITSDAAQRTRAATVLSAWLRDEHFLDRKGDPRDLEFGSDRGFAELIRRYSGDMKARAMADELLAAGAIEEVDGRLRMTSRGYVPGTDPASLITVLGTDPVQLIETIDFNMRHEEKRYQRKVEYDNVPAEAAPEFRALSARLSQHVLEELDRWLAQRDLGRKVSKEPTVSLGLAIYQVQGPSRGSPTGSEDEH